MSGELQPVEVVLARLRPSARALFWPSVALILVAGAAGFFAGRFPESWENLAVLAAAGLLGILLWLVPLLRWLSRNYTITTRRVIVRNGIGTRTRQELLLSRSYEVTVRKRGLQALFGSGDVSVSAGRDGAVVLRDVPQAKLVQSALADLIESANRGRNSSDHPDESFFGSTR